MGWVTGIATYFLIWWIAIFVTLPLGVKMAEPQQGHAYGAPANPRLGFKFLVTSVISAIIWLVIYALVEIEIIDFRAISAVMMQEDRMQ
jgi:predicted secreted protein